MEQAETLSHTASAETFLECVIEFLRERPAYLQLLAAPIRLSRDPDARMALRVAIANAFRAKDGDDLRGTARWPGVIDPAMILIIQMLTGGMSGL
jgi:hypothetical protein